MSKPTSSEKKTSNDMDETPGAGSALSPKEGPGAAGVGGDSANSGQETKKAAVLVSHKTTYEKYRCAGLVLTRKPENYLVTEEQYEKLSRDPWVEVKK